jgi:hypothetical protein
VTTTKTLPTDSIVSTSDSFYKDGRKISVGDCALFEPPQNHPPFIGIIRWLSNKKDKDNSNNTNLVLGVSWLYRPSELELGKGVLVNAEPNEIFYSFHKDEIPAASLLHPCKVAFLPKDVQLSPGISSFICRQVYDIANNCLWWLTDRDYIDERQEEVEKLLYKTRIEMHATVQPGGRSPKPLSVNTSSASQLKPATDNVQSSSTSYPSQVKRKKREHRDHGSEPSKPERSSKSEDSESAQFKSESLKSEIAKITEKGGLVNAEGVEKLVQLMQPNREEMNNVDLYSRTMLAGVIAATDRFDCLSWFVQLRGLPVLDEWLQDIHQGRIGDGSSRKNGGDKSAEEFLLVLLRALDKLPVNLQALQMCNIGRSVNHLRTNKNTDIQKKARSLVDTWKKRVEAEMNSIDSKSVSTQPVSWSSKSRLPEVSHPGNRHTIGTTEPAVKSPVTQLSASKTSSSVKPATANIPNTKSASSSPRQLKESGKDAQYPRISVPDIPSATKEERSSSSSQSHNCSQSFSGKEDARSSTAGSISVNKSTPQHPKIINGIPGPGPAHRETGLSRTLHRTSSPSCDKAVVPVVEGNSRKLIVKIPNRVRSPAQSGSEDRKDSAALHSEKRDELITNYKEKSDVNGDYFQSDEFKALLNGCDDGGGSSPPQDEEKNEEKSKVADDAKKSTAVSKAAKLNDASFSSMKALIESCAKFSETNTSLSSGDDIGIKLLASVAAEEISMSDHDSPTHSPRRNAPVPDKSESSPKDLLARTESQRDSCADNDNGDRKVLSEEPATQDLQLNTKPVIETSEKLIESKGAPARVSEKRDIVGDKAIVSKETNADSTQTDTKAMGKSSLLVKHENPAVAVSPSTNLVGNEGAKTLDERCNTGYAEQKHEHPQDTRKEMLQSPSSARNLGPEVADRPGVIKSEEPDMRSPHSQAKAKLESDVLKDIANHALVGSIPTHKHQKTEYTEEKLGNHVPQGGAEPYGRSKKFKVSGVEAEETGETAGVSLFSDTKVKFDLNEGFVVDDVKYGEPVKVSSIPADHLPYPVSSSVSVSLPASITVTAAAKRPFLPPEDLRRTKGELGWKGSAATSAFRPAEPRKIQEPTTTTPTSSKHSRPMLDFDLNAPGDELPDDMDTCSAPARGSGGGLDLDLNQADETNDTEQHLFLTSGSSSNRGLDISLAPVKPPVPSASASASASAGGFSRDFDLNNGPAFDDTSAEPLYHRHGGGNMQQSQVVQAPPHTQPAMGGMRMNSVEMGSFASWFAPGGNNSNGSPVVVPSMLPNRGGEKHFPGGPQIIAAAPPQQRILGGGPHFTPDVYWGSVLPSSSPSVPFSSTPFQYPVFPFGATFPLPSSSGGAAAYMDTPTGGRICFPTMQGPPVGPGGGSGGGPPSQYPRPYMISNAFLDANNSNNNSNSGGAMDNNRKWSNSRQGGLDLNAGPGVVDVDGREDVYTQRQFSFVSPQALKEEQARMLQAAAAAAAAGGGGVMKRKEPEGGWDMDGYRYKQSSRQ